jgi:eukaryotic-like serine/threonine-protein kinase
MTESASPTVVGRYLLHAPIARGGMATIHLARLLGAEGFSRMVAAKRLHPQFVEDAEFLEMFLDEARIASKVHHPNVVPVLDVVQSGSEVILVQEYVHGVALDKLLRAARHQKKHLPIYITVAIVSGMLAGLAAAHDARDEMGKPLSIVHRDVSPQNVLVGADGTPRLVDFGVAKAALNTHITRAGVFKGKLGYSSPELLHGLVTPAVDIFASGVLLWEALVGRRLYTGLGEAELHAAVSTARVPRLSAAVEKADVSSERWQLLLRLEPVVAKATAFEPDDRYPTAAEMQDALLQAVPAATPGEVSKWVKILGKEYLSGREQLIVSEESSFRKRQAIADRPTLDDVPEPKAPESTAAPIETMRVSVITVPPAERQRAGRSIYAALVIAGALCACTFILSSRRSEGPASSSAAPAAAAPAQGPLPVTVAESIAPPAAPSIDPDGGAAAKAAASAAVASQGPRWSRPSSAISRAAQAAAAPSGECDPPFFFQGKKKVFKPGCL